MKKRKRKGHRPTSRQLKIHPGVLSPRFNRETKVWLLVIMHVKCFKKIVGTFS